MSRRSSSKQDGSSLGVGGAVAIGVTGGLLTSAAIVETRCEGGVRAAYQNVNSDGFSQGMRETCYAGYHSQDASHQADTTHGTTHSGSTDNYWSVDHGDAQQEQIYVVDTNFDRSYAGEGSLYLSGVAGQDQPVDLSQIGEHNIPTKFRRT
ncbi:hypothetical protein L486_08220 [Kwoniella mangroviensis CBS 10435]|uniref:Uncharacterized protein n=1 Tax=Kwoniella mangroviensis CBS 10435 TaxID=1331196 RepID=A0A1B9IFG6_9TREE|nr:hypothetical protein L486_08220 [Kwoniella mangroviensis CBS 10435]